MKLFRTAYVLMILLALAACEEVRDNGDKVAGTDPVTECVIPQSAHSGGEVILQWNGFADDARILIRSNSVEFETEVIAVTSSGMIFKVPVSLQPGEYELVLVQGSETVLGRISIMAPDMPVSGLSVPSSALAGDVLVISGVGFVPSAVIRIEGEDGLDIILDTELVRDGLQVVVPGNLEEGKYRLYLVQDGFEWEILPSFTVASAARRLRSVTSVGPYFGTVEVAYTWNVEDPQRIVLSEKLISPDETQQGAEDVYECVSENSFRLVSDGFESSNDVEMTYLCDDEGRVYQSDVLIYGKSAPTAFTWEYDHAGRLEEIIYESRQGLSTFRALEYQEGNLALFRTVQFEYADSQLQNHPSAPDVVWAYMSLMEKFDPFVYFPYLLGWYDVASSELPTAMSIVSGTTTSFTPLSYEFDDKGYVVKMSWKEGNADNRILFEFCD